MATNMARFPLPPSVTLNPEHKTRHPCSAGISRLSRFSSLSSYIRDKNTRKVEAKQEALGPLWDDGYGTQTVKDYLEAAKDMTASDVGPPRWFCPTESGPPLKDSPLLLYLPGIDGLGIGLIVHHKALGKVFELRCMHIPMHDRTPYDKLVKFVENAVRAQHALFPNKPIYLLGDSFGGCLALCVAASNPTIDLVLILVNPATSFHRSKLQPWLPFLDLYPEKLNTILPYLLGIALLGDPVRMANVINTKNPLISLRKKFQNLVLELSSLTHRVSSLARFSKQALIWKIKLLESGSSAANSHLDSIKHETLILASGKDNIFPSKAEAERLSKLLQNSRMRFFRNHGHALLMEDSMNLLTVIKGTGMYRRSKRHDHVADFVPPSESESRNAFDKQLEFFRVAISPVMLSTLRDGKIVRGLAGVPDTGPVLLVGYHMLLGAEIGSIIEEFLREKKIMVRGMAHPEIFTKNIDPPLSEMSGFDYFRVFGATPATSANFFKLLSSKSHVLLYPGGIREALHRKGEEYRLFWPEEPEFVRMAARFQANIVPFGVVGEDDLVKLIVDYNDLMRIPLAKEIIRRKNKSVARVGARQEKKGEVSKQDFFVPGFYPKLPGRFYFLFGKPMTTEGRRDLVKDKTKASEFYMEIKAEVERSLAYLMAKREEDPYRGLVDRLLYRAVSAPVHQIPAFEP